jgi:thiazole synthase
MIAFELNGEPRSIAPGLTIADLAREIGLDPAKIAVERNLGIVPRSTLNGVMVEAGDKIEIVHFVGGGQ